MLPLSKVCAEPASLVTVCVMLPFCHVTVVPAVIVRVDGLNDSAFVIHTLDAVGVHVPPPPPPPPHGDVEPPHAASSTTPAAPRGNAITANRKDPPRLPEGQR